MEPPVRAASPADAMPWVARKTGLPAALPPLPAGAKLDPEDPIDMVKARHWATVTLNFKLAPKRWLFITYGPNSIWKDGCEPPARRVVDVNGQRALLTKPDGYCKWSTIVWPVEPGSLEGQYSIHGSIRPKKALEMARAMDLAIATTEDRFDKDC